MITSRLKPHTSCHALNVAIRVRLCPEQSQPGRVSDRDPPLHQNMSNARGSPQGSAKSGFDRLVQACRTWQAQVMTLTLDTRLTQHVTMPKPRRRGGTPKNQSEEELRAELKRLREIVNSEGSGTFTPGPKLQALLAGILVVLVIVFANQLMPVPKIAPEDIRHPQRSGGKYSTESMSVNDDIAGSIAFDCSGIPFHNGHISQLKGDGVCDNGWVSVNLSCPRYGFDGGDCGKHEAFSFDEFGPDIDIAAILHDRHYVRNTNTQVWKSKTTPDSPSRDTLPIQPRKGTATVTDEEIEEFQQDGHVLIDGLFSPEELAPFRTVSSRNGVRGTRVHH